MINKVQKKIIKLCRRMYNKIHLYDYPECSNGWKKSGFPVISSNNDYFDPYLCLDEPDKLYVSNRTKNKIVVFDATDPINLINEVTILEHGNKGTWDETVNRACLLKRDNMWLMWYTGQQESRSCIGFATSKDGVTFTKYERNPIIVPEKQYESYSVMNPCVLWDKNDCVYKMWYSAGEQYEPDVICYAASEDGINWLKSDCNPVLKKGNNKYDCYKVGGCNVHKTNSGYEMFYIGYENIDNARICLATSKNGITGWQRSEHNPILSPSKGKWDSDATYKPAVMHNEKGTYLWYNGRKKDRETIGFSYCEKETFQID